MAKVRVWDRVVRFCHWLIALGVLLAWWSRNGDSALGRWHEEIGYLVLATLTLRLAWLGLARNPWSRLSSFLCGPSAALTYLLKMLRHQAPRHLGHNPLGGWMVVGLWSLLALICLSGWLYTTDRFWGIEWVEQAHAFSTYALLALLPLHLLGVLASSLLHRENLVTAMVSGDKRES